MQSDPAFLCDNARGFCDSAAGENDSRLYFLAISIELSLKAFLRHAGWNDDDTKRLGHNIMKASTLARSLGLDVPRMSHRDILPTMSLTYSCGGFRRWPFRTWPDSWVEVATAYAIELNERVSICVK